MTTCTCDTFSVSSNSTVLTVNQTSATSTATQVIYAHSSNGGMPYVIYAEGANTGILGKSYCVSGIGLSGQATATSGYGVYATSAGQSGIGVYAGTGSTTSTAVQATNAGTYGYSLRADATGSNTFGLYVNAPYSTTGTYASVINGNEIVYGSISKSSGTFTIDHPLDPENKILQHSFVESPDMKNIYDGVAVLDASGNANVYLPSYFTALNKDYRYQLTPIGAASPSLHISKEIKNGVFSISGGTASSKVSWQITGIRQDAHALKNPVVVELDKEEYLKGSFIDADAHGFGQERSFHAATERKNGSN
jgi:hypothetical protein